MPAGNRLSRWAVGILIYSHTHTETVMVSREDLESFLIRMDLEYEEVDEGMFLTRGEDGGLPLVVNHADEHLLIRMKVMDLPEEDTNSLELYRTLLKLNATEVVHGAYGIEEGELILSDTLELETLDFHELQASMESIALAAATHMDTIRKLAGFGRKEAEG